jgi:probable HAF family extracellular repeat protein
LNAISNGDVAVGGSTTLGGSYSHAMIWDPTNGLRDLNSLIVNPPTTWTPTAAIAISQTGGFIAGIGASNISTAPPSGTEHAYVVSGGSLTEIPDPGSSIQPESINSSGEAVGFCRNLSGQVEAFVYTSQQGTREIESLGLSVTGSTTPGIGAFGINDLGTVVGADNWADGSVYAFLYTDASGAVEFDPPAGLVFDGAYGINDDGQVIAQGYYTNGTTDGYRGFLLTPVPEPGTLTLSITIALILFINHYRRHRFPSLRDSAARAAERDIGSALQKATTPHYDSASLPFRENCTTGSQGLQIGRSCHADGQRFISSKSRERHRSRRRGTPTALLGHAPSRALDGPRQGFHRAENPKRARLGGSPFCFSLRNAARPG